MEVERAGRFEAWRDGTGGDSAPLPPDGSQIRVRGTLRAGVMAIGAETTGVTVRAGGREWELELRPELLEKAGALSGRSVVATGRLRIRPGVELRQRTIVEVRTVAEAGTGRAR